MWGEPPSNEEVAHRDSFYDTVVETWATKVQRGPSSRLYYSAPAAGRAGGARHGKAGAFAPRLARPQRPHALSAACLPAMPPQPVKKLTLRQLLNFGRDAW